jgi:site-specific DNA recombinase
MFEELWDHCPRTQEASEVDQFLDRITQTSVPAVISRYEERINKLEGEKLLASERLATCGQRASHLRRVTWNLAPVPRKPLQIVGFRASGGQKILLKLTFADRIPYVRGEGFRVPVPSLPFKALADFCAWNQRLAGIDQQRLAAPRRLPFGRVSRPHD